MKQTTDEDQVVLAEMADLMTRQLKALHSGGSMFVYFYEADGRHMYRITKEEIVNTIAHEFVAQIPPSLIPAPYDLSKGPAFD